MMQKIQEHPLLPNPDDPEYSDKLNYQLTTLFRRMALSHNGLAEGKVYARYAADTAAPTTGDHAQGDLIYNSTPSELGTVGAKYVIISWICTVSGTPGTWLECQTLSGN